MIVAVVPVKDLGQAKQRLASVLAPEERVGLVKAMLGDVLAVLKTARRVAHVYLVAHDRAFDAMAEDVIRETANTGYNAAIATAVADHRVSGVAGVLVVPGDVPLLTAEEVDRLVAPLERGIRLVPARDGDGTNGLLIAPPDLIATRFGPGSAGRHQAAGLEAGGTVERLDAPGLAFDIDTPDDLADFRAVDAETMTHTFLERSGVGARMSDTARST